MQTVKSFYFKSYYFWEISRILLIICFAVAICGQDNFHTKASIYIVSTIIVFYLISMAVQIPILNSDKLPLKIFKWYSGIFSIFFGFVLSCLILFTCLEPWWHNVGFLILPFWIILFGIREIIKLE